MACVALSAICWPAALRVHRSMIWGTISHSASSLNVPGRLTDGMTVFPGFSQALHSGHELTAPQPAIRYNHAHLRLRFGGAEPPLVEFA
eukprot:9121655-Pyramimonas_sp.AAC.1